MERYGDLDELKLKVQRYMIPNDGCGMVSIEQAERWFLKLLDEAPTDDVVPKSEVEVLEAELSRYTENLMQMREQDKRNIAREIFEEIYRSVASKIPMEIRPIFKDDRDFDVGFINGKRDALLDVLVLASELKKKYTED